MASKQVNKYRLGIKILLVVLVTLSFNLIFIFVNGHAKTSLPDFESFVRSVENGQSNVLRGVYAPRYLHYL